MSARIIRGNALALPLAADTVDLVVTTTYVIEVEWTEGARRLGLPKIIGPFDSKTEAVEYGERNISNGVWNVAPVAYPYSHTDPRPA